MANIPEFISVLRRIRDEIYPEVEEMYENTATLKSEAELSKIAAATSAQASASSAATATTRANEIKNISTQANTLSSGSLATVSYNSTDGKFTFGLPVGAKGDKGESYTINAKGTTSGRAAYDTQSVGFSYLDITLSIVYFKLSATSGDWSTGTSFGKGEDGADGADGTGITSIVFHSTTSDNGLASQTGGIDTYRITLSNSNTYDISLINGNDLNINGYDDKKIPKDDDEFAISDSEDVFLSKKIKWSNVKKSIVTGFKNYIIDGTFDFWYEGTSQTSSGYGSDTMWVNSHVGSTKTHSRQSFTAGETFPDGNNCPKYFSRTVVSSVAGAGNYIQKSHRIEDVTRLAGKTVTVSFYAKADASKNITIELGQQFGTGGSPSSDVVGIDPQKIAITTTWTKYTRTITLPSISGKTIGTNGVNTSSTYLNFWFDAGSTYNSRTATLGQQSGTFDISKIRLEEGTADTKYDDRPFGVELSLVDRYYELKQCTIYSQTNVYFQRYFRVVKRVTPSVSLVSGSTNGADFAANGNTALNCPNAVTATGGATSFILAADARL